MANYSSNAASNRVVSLNGLGRDRNPGNRILGECRDQLIIGLCGWLRDIAAPVSDELFVLADSTRDRLQQTRYLDLRADIESDWTHLVETFRRDLSAEAERCQNQNQEKENRSETPLDIPDFDGLQLVDDEDLSEHIVIREFSAQLSESCDEELYTLNRRVAALLGHEELIDSANPLSPAIVCTALSDACATIGSDSESRLLLMRRLERHLHLGLPPIYRQINAYLIERGILPDLKRTYRRSGVASSADNNQTSSPASSTAPQGAPGSTAITQATGEGILEALQRIALTRSNFLPATGQPVATGNVGMDATGNAGNLLPGTPGVMLDAAAVNQLLLTSLNALQHAPAPIDNAGGGIVNQVRMVRESESAQQVGGLEAVTIDIVAMLFDFIFDDNHIPVAIKALLSRLQIPVLKVAMLNPGFFADRQHPTRRFLGSVSGVSIRWGDSVDETDPFYKKLGDLVEKIQAEFENDVEVFGSALAELEAFVAEHEGDEDNTALTAANMVMNRERETESWSRAQGAVNGFRAANRLPAVLDSFLEEHWTRVLQKAAFNDDEAGTNWTAANEVMSNLLWSIEAKKNPNDRLKLISLLPGLLGQLNKGLDSIGAEPEKRKVFFDVLVQYHSAALKGDTVSPPPANTTPATEQKKEQASFAPPEEGDLLVTRSIDNDVEVEEVILVGASPIWRADDREIFRQVSELRRGDWVEFHDEEGKVNRERLNWISPQRGILLFSNHRAAKAISIAPDALARLIRDGKASIVEEEAIFERALSGALESLDAS